MATITEDYISFKIAKLLKEKGFDERCTHYYKNEKYLVDLGYSNIHSYTNSDLVEGFVAPTLQMTMKWLREEHKLSIEPYYDIALSWVVDIKYIGKYTNYNEFEEVRSQTYNSYEQACEAGINYSLKNLI